MTDNDQWYIIGDPPSYPMGSLEHAISICEIAKHNMADMIVFTTLPSWAIVKLLDALEETRDGVCA